jgi:serine/threonine protein kinase
MVTTRRNKKGRWIIKIIDFGIAADQNLGTLNNSEALRKEFFTTAVGTQMWQPPELREAVQKKKVLISSLIFTV